MHDFTYQETLELASEIENQNSKELIVPDRLHKACSLIKRYRDSVKPVEDFRTDITHLIAGGENLRIMVTKTNLRRALLFFDTFIKLAEARSHKIEVKGDKTLIIVKGQELGLRLREPNRATDKLDKFGWNTRTFKPSGQLCFSYENYRTEKEWRDTNTVKIEDKLAVIMAFLELKAEKEIRWKKEVELDRKIRERETELNAYRQHIIANEKKDYHELLNDSDRWQKYLKVSSYIAQIEKDRTKSEAWIKWAKKKATWIDPRNDTEDEILGKFSNT